jgi:hypothetical protein
MIHQLPGHTQPLGPLLSSTIGVVDNQLHDLGTLENAAAAGPHQGFKVASRPRGQDAKAQGWHQTGRRLQRPLD